MDQPMSKEESYADRRKLFKNIWDTSMHVDEKEDIMKKTKIIKTLRLDEMDRCTAGKKKKQRIKNLRAVCNKLLDFCDRQDADDLFYEQMAAQGQDLKEMKVKKKRIKIRKSLKKTKSMLSSTNMAATARVTISEMKDGLKAGNCTSRNKPSNKIKRTSFNLAMKKSINPEQSNKMSLNSGNSEVACTSQKIIRKKPSKNKPELNLIKGIIDDLQD